MSGSSANPVGGPFSQQVSPSPYPSSPTNSHSPIDTHDGSGSHTGPDGPNVLSRLHALFRADTREGESTRRMSIGERLDRCRTGPASLEVPTTQSLETSRPKEREAIKVMVITWNMGDALPKGDLTVLLGEVPTYEPAQNTDRDSLPELPVEHKHPYHIVVVAGQECPTPSGVPRGLGGVMKGMSVRVGHHKKKDKSEKKDSLDKDDSDSSSDEERDSDATPRNQSPMPTPTLGQRAPTTTKGWSTMLDDWFCGAPIKPNLVAHSPTVPNSPSFPATHSSLAPPSPPSLARSNSAPEMSPTDSFSLPIPMPQSALPTPSLDERSGYLTSNVGTSLVTSLGASPMIRQNSSDSSSPASSLAGDDFGLVPPPVPSKQGSTGSEGGLPVKSKPDRPGLVIPVTEVARTGLGTGSYVHVVKERLMGMYLTIYVYKGCEHLVQGVDKDFVTAGLAGGRLGNKGAIGISLKLADHRFLFVNSHLAAHTKRVSARLANIEKIKSELVLDTFLPKDDPRSQEADLADRFDSVFWCGDLNFRLDMSRLHAQWLVDQKNYSELLMWDQLRGVMKDPDNNPFPGFEEGPIDFPPTFKYDVWKSIKATNRDMRRSLRRNGTIDGRRETGAKEIAKDLAKTLSPITMEEGEEDAEGEGEECERESEYQTDTGHSRRSYESSAGRSMVETDDDSRSEKHIDASAYGSRHKALEVVIKSKTKKFLSYVKMDSVLTRERSLRRKRDRDVSGTSATSSSGVGGVGHLGKSPKDFDQASRRTSMSSMASNHTRLEVPMPQGLEIPSPSPNHAQGHAHGLGPSTPQSYQDNALRRPSASSWLTSSPPQRTPVRRMSLLKRTVSGRSVNTNEHPEGVREEDNREGVYDTSKKQRVPSWCDRVLWKAHIVPDPVESPSMDDVSVPREKRASRFSNVISNLGGHFRSSITRTTSMDHVVQEGRVRSLPPTPPSGPATTLVESPTASPTMKNRTLSPESGIDYFNSPTDRFRATRKSNSTSPGVSPLGTSTRHPLLDRNLVLAAPSKPTITFDLASPNLEHDRQHPPRSSSFRFRPRANSHDPHTGGKPVLIHTNSAGNVNPNSEHQPRDTVGSHFSFHRKTSSPTKPHLPETDSDLTLRHAKTQYTPVQGPTSSTTASLGPAPSGPQSGKVDREEQRGAFMKFIRDLPNIIQGRHSIVAPGPGGVSPLSTDNLIQIPRRRKGEVVCLHYGTIDDQGMRQLEGRSDHRPAIFSAAVYV